MHMASGRLPESDSIHYTPRAQLFAALKQRKFSGENFSSLLNECQLHKGLTSGDANQPLKEVDDKSPQSSFQISLPVLPPNACTEESEETKHDNISAQSQLSFLSDDHHETSVNVKQMPKSLLFYQLKRVPTALPPVRVEGKLSDSQTAETVSQLPDSSGILAEPSIRSTLKHTESTKTLSELLNSSNSKQTECIKYTPGKSTVGHRGSRLKRKGCKKTPVVMLSRISQSEHSIICNNDNDLADDNHEEKPFTTSTCSPFKSQQSEESKDFHAPVLVWSSLILASSVTQEDALDKTSNNQETPHSSTGISVPNLLPSAELLSPKALTSELESNSVNDRLFSRKTRINVRHAAPLSAGKDVCFSREDVQIQSSSDEIFELRSTPRRGPSSIDQSVRLKVVELDKWALRLDLDQRLSLAGYRKDEPGGGLHCSDPVTQCLRKDVVQTTSGVVYRLSGRLCKHTSAEAGLSNKFLQSFLDGFPPNWEDLLNNALKTISSRMPDNHSHVQKIVEKATPPLSASAEDSKESSESVKTVKSAAALKNASVAKILSNKGSKNDPLTLQDLPVTRRSGRVVIPPLAWWANQRVMVDPTSNATVIAQENVNRLDLPAVHFKSGSKISSEEIGEELEESRKTDVEKKERKATKDEKQFVETSSKKRRGRPRKRTDLVMQEMEVEGSSTTDAIKERQGIRLAGGQLQDGVVSVNSFICSLPGLPHRGKNKSDEISVLVFHDSRRSRRKQERLIKTSRSCSTAVANTACHSAQKSKTLNSRNCMDYQPDGFSSTDCPHSLQMPQQTSPLTHSRRSLTMNRKRSIMSDLKEETSGSSGRRKSCNVESDRNGMTVPAQHGTKLNRTCTLRDSKLIQNSDKQKVQNSTHHCPEKLLNREENERKDHDYESMRKTRSCSVGPPNRKLFLTAENTGEKGEQKTLMRRRSTRVHVPSHKYQVVCPRLSSVQQRSRSKSDSEEGWSAGEQSAQKRTKKHSIKNLSSRESTELVYAKSDHLQKTVVMRHDSKKRRERATKDQFSFLTESPLLMQGLPPKPRPSQLHASGNLSDLCDSDDSAKVEYFFSSDESET